jgi:hypothetical protein
MLVGELIYRYNEYCAEISNLQGNIATYVCAGGDELAHDEANKLLAVTSKLTKFMQKDVAELLKGEQK